jgi:protein-disulfide isomerase
MALSVVLALAVACGGDEQSQNEPAATPTQEARTPTPSPNTPETGMPRVTPTVAQPTATAQLMPTPTVAQPTATVAKPTTVAQATPTTPAVVQASVDDDPAWGPEDAAVTIIEFSDFLCPYCQRFALQTLPQIEQAYEGKIRYVYRDFATHGQPAVKTAEAAQCANDQGKFWEYHDKLWENFQASSQQAQIGTDALVGALKGYASELGLDPASFNECLDSDKYAAEVQKDKQDGQSYGVGRTPAFFVNGQLVSGAQPFSVFQQLIEAALAGDESGSAVPTVPRSGG